MLIHSLRVGKRSSTLCFALLCSALLCSVLFDERAIIPFLALLTDYRFHLISDRLPPPPSPPNSPPPKSYAGIYVPMLTEQVVASNAAAGDGDLKINLKGILVGNGCGGSESDSCGMPPSTTTFLDSPAGQQMQLAFDVGLISPVTFNEVKAACTIPLDDEEACYPLTPAASVKNPDNCWRVNQTWYQCILTDKSNPAYACCNSLEKTSSMMGQVNIYSIYGECIPYGSAAASSDASNQRRRRRRIGRSALRKPDRRALSVFDYDESVSAFHRLTRKGLGSCWGQDEAMQHWFNDTAVRKALHVETYPGGEWAVCNDW